MRIGIDVLTIDELDRLNTREWFRRHTYCDDELGYAATLTPSREREFLAGRFAAKEAVVKALGTGFGRGVQPAQICVVRDERSAPVVHLSGAAARRAQQLGLTRITVSIAHKGECVISVALADERCGSAAAVAHQADNISTGALQKIIQRKDVRKRAEMGIPENADEVTATLRVRMSPQDAHYGGHLVSGARLLQMFGDLITEITIKIDGDEGLLTGYQDVEFLAPVEVGDYVEANGRLRSRSRLRRTVEFAAHKTITQRYDLGTTRAETPTEPVLVCRAVGTSVVPPAAARRSARSDTATNTPDPIRSDRTAANR